MVSARHYELACTALRSVIIIPTVKPNRKGVFHKTIPSPVKEPSQVKGREEVNAGCLLRKFLYPLRNVLKGRKNENAHWMNSLPFSLNLTYSAFVTHFQETCS
jgi:hypothetical protein